MKLNTRKFFEMKSEFQDFYIEKSQNQVEVNRLRLIRDSKWLLEGKVNKDTDALRTKIKNAIKRSCYKKTSETDILIRIIEGDEVCHDRYMISPKRQNSKKDYGQEFLQDVYISNKLSEIGTFEYERLNNNGRDSYRIFNGEIVKGISKNTNTSKSIDFILHNQYGLDIYSINKVTASTVKEKGDSGGAQSNQMELAEKGCDTIDFSLKKYQNTYILLIFDGNYFYKNKYVLNLIEKYKDNKHIYITTSDGIKEVIGSILHNK
jgi:hypothetical protein